MAVCVLPLLLLGLLEAGLRLADYGYETSFFVARQEQGRIRLTTNRRFGFRFFPPNLARTPTPFSFIREKPAGTYRIFLFGESAALGDPNPAFGMGRYLQALLELRFPQTRFEVIPAAMTAINSHALREVALECGDYDGDLWVIYMGNNEMAGPFGALSLFGSQAPPMPLIRANLALQKTRVGQALANLLRRGGTEEAEPDQWTGLGMFTDQAMAPDDPRRQVVHEHFQENLREIIRAGRNAAAEVLLCTVAVNLADCPPFSSRHASTFEASQETSWTNWVQQGVAQATQGNWSNALTAFNEAQTLDPDYAEVRYRQGRVTLALTNQVLAATHLAAACDADALPFRTDSVLDNIVRETAAEAPDPGVRLLDLEALLNAAGPAGQELFLDHVHFDLPGNEQAARLLAAEITQHLPEALKASAAADFASTTELERRIALTDWNRVTLLNNMITRLQEPPFSGQLDQSARLDRLTQRVAILREGLHPRRYLETEDTYLAAIQRDPNDPRFQESFAEFLQATDDLPRAVECWKRVSELLPEDAVPWFQQGRLLARLDDLDAAHEALLRCLELRPDLDNARVEVGQILFRQKKYEEALVVYRELRQRHPKNARLLRLMAEPLGALNRREEVITCLKQAVDLQPDYWEAHYLLGIELGSKRDFSAAQREFQIVLQFRPNFVLARINLGVSYVRTGKLQAAQDQFTEALRLDPNNADALRHLETLQELIRRAEAAR